jgi:hypothetical protein
MQQNGIPKWVVLQTPEGEHLGFVLLAVRDGTTQGECIFMVLPPNTAIWDTPLVRSLFARKELGESRVEVTPGPPMSMQIVSTGLPDLIIELGADGGGAWREGSPGTHHGHAASAAAA